MIHYAPVCQRGASNSPYSIRDQLSLADDLFGAVTDDDRVEEAGANSVKKDISESPLSVGVKKLSVSKKVPLNNLQEPEKHTQLKQFITSMHEKHGIFSVTDIVWNHTSFDSEWLQTHPEAGYNLRTAPWLRSAYELDDAIVEYSAMLREMRESERLTAEELTGLINTFRDGPFQKLKLFEFYVLDVKSLTIEFESAWSTTNAIEEIPERYSKLKDMPFSDRVTLISGLALRDDNTYNRFSKSLDVAEVVIYIQVVCRLFNISDHTPEFTKTVDSINVNFYKKFDEDSSTILSQIRNRAQYIRIDSHGPRLGAITRATPLVDTYFTRLPKNDKTASLHVDEMMLACNGWIWNADPLVNFAGADSTAYLLRQVISWGDCVKLRYGDSPADSPWLWEHQKEYTLKMADLFHGFRIDNCHSTPLHVATYLLDAARAVRPNLYVFAELFTGSEEKDIVFVRELGINSLIREAMNAWDPKEMSRLVHRQGGGPVGSISLPPNQLLASLKEDTLIYVKQAIPHVLFMDCTHDNETPHQKRTSADTLSTAALVCMTACAVGSVKGFDELIPVLLDVVGETRKYRLPESTDGISQVKMVMNRLHTELTAHSEIHVNQEGEYVSVHRVHPVTSEGVLLIARTAFNTPSSQQGHSPIRLHSQDIKLVLEASIIVESVGEPVDKALYKHQPGEPVSPEDLLPQPSSPKLYHAKSMDEVLSRIPIELQYCDLNGGCINGLPSNLKLSNDTSTLTSVKLEGNETVITVNHENFIRGSVVVYRTFCTTTKDAPSLNLLQVSLGLDHTRLTQVMSQLSANVLDSCSAYTWAAPGLNDAVSKLTPAEINVIMYKVGQEEMDTIGTANTLTLGDNVYDVPGSGPLSYAGIQGLVSALLPVARTNNLSSPICANIRKGDWIINHLINRLEKYSGMYPGLKFTGDWLRERLNIVKQLGPAYKPKYFAIVVMATYESIKNHAIRSHSMKRTSSLSVFGDSCALTTFQMLGSVKCTGLFSVPYPLPLTGLSQPSPVLPKNVPSLAAGLPHFAIDYARCWGRDIFLSLRGLLIIPGHFSSARAHLIAFGSTLKHGLIPNLLDQAISPRYNARDAVWFWVDSVISYIRESDEGIEFLDVKVARRFIPLRKYCNKEFTGELKNADEYIPPADPRVYSHTSTIAELVQEILERHAIGINFVEHNAGTQIDHAMKPEGFNVKVGVNQSGFVYGGNRWNCGTWMDKMGDSSTAGTLGVPATPRDGSAIELVGILKGVLSFIVGLQRSSTWHFKGVTHNVEGKETFLTYSDWADLIQKSFEKFFYIPLNPAEDANHEIQKSLVHRRGVYKDTVGSVTPFADYQLRPNCCVAMIKAPELFDPDHCRKTLLVMKDSMLGPLDWAYRGNYDNNNQSNDPSIAHGFNYHQGPEWVWVFGYFLRAYLHFFTKAEGFDPAKSEFHINEVQRLLLNHKVFLLDSEKNPFAGLPELTNMDGGFCSASCPTQAWSTGVMIELVHDLRETLKKLDCCCTHMVCEPCQGLFASDLIKTCLIKKIVVVLGVISCGSFLNATPMLGPRSKWKNSPRAEVVPKRALSIPEDNRANEWPVPVEENSSNKSPIDSNIIATLDLELPNRTIYPLKDDDLAPDTLQITDKDQPSIPPPDEGYAWVICFGSFVVQFFALGVAYIFGVYQLQYQSEPNFAGISTSAISIIGSLNAGGLMLFSIPSGNLADKLSYRKLTEDKYGPRLMGCIGGAGYLVSFILAAYSHTYWEILITQGFLVGTSISFAYFSTLSILSQWFVKKKGLAIGIAVSGSGCGGLVMSPVTQALIDGLGISNTLLITGIVGGAAIILASLLFKQRIPVKLQVGRQKPDYMTVLKNNKFQLLYLGLFICAFGYFDTYAVKFGMSAATGSLLLAILNGATAVGRVVMGVTSDHMGHLNAFILCMTGSTLCILLIWPFCQDFGSLTVFAILFGLFVGGYFSVIPNVVQVLFGTENIGAIVGLVYSSNILGTLGNIDYLKIGGPFLASEISAAVTTTSSAGVSVVNYIPAIMFSGGCFFIATCIFAAIVLVEKRK